MARKGNQQKNGLERNTSNHKKGGPDSESPLSGKEGRGNLNETKVVDGSEPLSSNQQGTFNNGLSKTNRSGSDKKSKKKLENFLRAESQGTDETQGLEKPGSCDNNFGDCTGNISTYETSSLKEETLKSPDCDLGVKNPSSSSNQTQNRLDTRDTSESFDLSYAVVAMRLRTFTSSVIKTSKEWLERHRPLFNTVVTNILLARDYARMKIDYAYPIVLRWLVHFANIMLLLFMLWLDCTLRGVDSVLRMGTTTFLTVIWCSILSLVAMIGFSNFSAIVTIAALLGLFVNFTISIILTAVSGVAFLWFYGSFWTTALFIFLAGLSFTFSHERLAMFIITVYSVYCAWTYVGWLGLFLCLDLSFISSDALIFFLRNNIIEHRRSSNNPEQPGGPGIFSDEQVHASFDRNPGVPSTRWSDSDLTSEDEIIRLLNSTDHYSALGLSRFEEVDASILKREYRKKTLEKPTRRGIYNAMQVHPDKNMGNEKAAEAFKKLQNAYEVLIDSLKRKTYDDELRREDLLNYFRRFQNAPQKTKGNGLFGSTFGRSKTDFDDPRGESRRIACRKCNDFHMWFYTKKTKSQARWCQECKDFHQAKDGDGWIEQSSQPLLFGILQKVDTPCAYVCADSKIFDATEWYICQGMRCPANTHKPSFHVNTSVTSKHNNGKATSSGQRGAAAGMPEENMTEEEFFDWLQNAVQSGMFDNLSGNPSDNQPPWAAAVNSSKSGGNNAGTSASGGSNSGGKRKKKSKKW